MKNDKLNKILIMIKDLDNKGNMIFYEVLSGERISYAKLNGFFNCNKDKILQIDLPKYPIIYLKELAISYNKEKIINKKL
jgi:hypothetical protein